MLLYFCILCPHNFVYPYADVFSEYFVYSLWLTGWFFFSPCNRSEENKKSEVVWLAVFFRLVPWLPVTRLLSLKLEFIFYKLKWNVFVFQVIISILLSSHLWLMKRSHQTMFHANEGARAAWLLPLPWGTCLSDRPATKGPQPREAPQYHIGVGGTMG